MNKELDVMLTYLPKFTMITKTPDYYHTIDKDVSINIEQVELKTKDVVMAFLSLQKTAIKNAKRNIDKNRKDDAIDKIRRMVFFGTKVYDHTKRKLKHNDIIKLLRDFDWLQ